MIPRILTLIIFSFFSLQVFGQDQKMIDSLEHIAKKNSQDSSSVSAYINLSQAFSNSDYQKSLDYAAAGLKVANALNDNFWKGRCCFQMGFVHFSFGYSKEAIDNYTDGITFFEDNKYWVAKCMNGIGNAQRRLGRLKEATDSFLAAKKLFEEVKDKKGIAGTYNNLGIILMAENQQEKALDYFKVASKMNIELNNQSWLGRNLGNMGTAFFNLAQYDSAEVYFKYAIKLDSAYDLESSSTDIMNLGNVYTSQKKYKQALEQFNLALDYDDKTGRESDKAMVMNNIAGLYMETGDFELAKKFLDTAVVISTKYDDLESLNYAYKAYTVFYEKSGDYKNAYYYFDRYAKQKDSITSTDMKNQMDQMEESFREEKLKEKNKLQDAELIQSHIINYAAAGGGILVLLLTLTIFKRYQLKKKANELLEENNLEIQSQKSEIEHKNREMVDSINYASRIQQAILPAAEKMNEIFPTSFLLFRPRDIVSGDFYWFAEKNGEKIIAAADCTGHGVPGALMSMIGNAFLNEIVMERGITKPSEILSELRRLVINALKQKGETGEQRDGMDISLLRFSPTGKIEWSGANNPLWLVRGNECREFDPDRRPIGFFKGKGLPFTNHEVETIKGDMLYIFTDGYADQFGGANERKLMKKNFRKILISHAQEPITSQKKNLNDEFDAWKGKLEQVDDICVIGIRI